MKLIRRAADAGFSAAPVALGEFYLYGNHVEIDLAESKLWYLKAAKQGNVIAEHNLGTMYHQGGDLLHRVFRLLKKPLGNMASDAYQGFEMDVLVTPMGIEPMLPP
ncbi:MAG: sel1 repeat family protein [Planctomycetales bacterium]|nr:sel1 repeat family protein [Planctomycetales bacterium]